MHKYIQIQKRYKRIGKFFDLKFGESSMVRYMCMDCSKTLWINRGLCEHCGSEKIHFCSR